MNKNHKKLKKSLKKVFKNDNFEFSDRTFKKAVSISLDLDVYDFLDKVCQEREFSRSAIISELVSYYAVSQGYNLGLEVGRVRGLRKSKKKS